MAQCQKKSVNRERPWEGIKWAEDKPKRNVTRKEVLRRLYWQDNLHIRPSYTGANNVPPQTSTTTATSLTLSNFRYLILSLVAKVHAACSLSPHNVLHSPSLIMDLWLTWCASIYYSATFLLALLWRLIMRREEGEEGRWTGVTSATELASMRDTHSKASAPGPLRYV